MRREPVLPSICSVPGCERPYAARGLCNPHHRSASRRGALPDEYDLPLRGMPYDRGEHHNPWWPECPPCDHCGENEQVYQWDEGRWYCAPCDHLMAAVIP